MNKDGLENIKNPLKDKSVALGLTTYRQDCESDRNQKGLEVSGPRMRDLWVPDVTQVDEGQTSIQTGRWRMQQKRNNQTIKKAISGQILFSTVDALHGSHSVVEESIEIT